MSRAGRPKISVTDTKVLAVDGTEVKPGDIRVLNPRTAKPMPPVAERAMRAQHVLQACKSKIAGRDVILWPPEFQGGMLGEQWLQEAVRKLTGR